MCGGGVVVVVVCWVLCMWLCCVAVGQEAAVVKDTMLELRQAVEAAKSAGFVAGADAGAADDEFVDEWDEPEEVLSEVEAARVTACANGLEACLQVLEAVFVICYAVKDVLITTMLDAASIWVLERVKLLKTATIDLAYVMDAGQVRALHG